MDVFMLQWRGRVVATKIEWFTKAKIFISWPFTEKVLPKSLISSRGLFSTRRFCEGEKGLPSIWIWGHGTLGDHRYNSMQGWKTREQWWENINTGLEILVWEAWPKTVVQTWMAAPQTSTVQGIIPGGSEDLYMFVSEERHKNFSCAWSTQWFSLYLLYFIAQLNISVVISLSKKGFSKCSCL